MRRYLLVLGITLALVVGVAAGYFIGARNIESAVALNCFMDELAALSYLEKGDVERARYSLRSSAEGNIVTLSRLGSTPLDKGKPQAVEKLLAHYKVIRDKYGPIEFGDDGTMNHTLDQALGEGQKAKTQSGVNKAP